MGFHALRALQAAPELLLAVWERTARSPRIPSETVVEGLWLQTSKRLQRLWALGRIPAEEENGPNLGWT